jgi:hypothetical protein
MNYAEIEWLELELVTSVRWKETTSNSTIKVFIFELITFMNAASVQNDHTRSIVLQPLSCFTEIWEENFFHPRLK